MTYKLRSTWLRRATYSGGYLTVTTGSGDDRSRWRDYTYKAPSWLIGVLCGWSAQGASVGSLWRRVARFCEPVEGETSDLDLTAALAASLEAA